jgi:signal peptidase I
MTTVRLILRLLVFPIVGAMALAFLVRSTCFRIFSIPSDSMAPTLVHGDQIVVTPYESILRSSNPSVGDVIVFRRGDDGWFVKRVVAVAGDHLETRKGRLRRNGRTVAEHYLPRPMETSGLKPEIVPAGTYYVLGDNRGDSMDSRSWGVVSRDEVYGRARMVLWKSRGTWTEPARAAAGGPLPPRARQLDRSRLFKLID